MLRLLKPSLRWTTRGYNSLAQALPVSGQNRARQSAAAFRPLAPLVSPPAAAKASSPVVQKPGSRSRRDEEISSRFVTFVDEQGQVHNRVRVSDVLNEFDRSKYFLVEVDPLAKPPVCRLLDKKALFEKEKQSKKKKQTAPESVLKEIVFGWNVSDHDMEHKLNKAIQFLDKGNKVKLDIVYKRGQKRVDKETQQQVIATVSSLMEDYKIAKPPAFNGNNCSMQFERK
ncbi:hypothetical protein INT47_000908 [Mucor saturninus]|uniref:Translation initiation factor IF-3 n=1 Tax=Mucor saturninus TaxID=64648 RepID=A0A8H7RNM4_9FUNG|nr:hypothetical protein INT47_000908 [Mucor saturninus]